MDTRVEKRKWKRIKTRLLAKIGDKSGILSDVSDNGIQISTNSIPEKKRVSIVFKWEEQTITIQGVIQWIRRKYSFQNSLQIGCLIEDAPQEYYDFVKSH